MNKAVFMLDANEKIMLFGKDKSVNDLLRCDDMLIIFESKKTNLTLFENFVFSGMEAFCFLLQKAVNNQARLHSSITYDIGYLWNQELDGEVKLVEENGFWVGKRNLLWSSTGDKKDICDSWLYNNEQGDIILEVTPTYRWHFSDPQPGDEFISYDDFMKSYQPILFRTIPKEVAQKWLLQAQAIWKQIETNGTCRQ